MNSAIIITYLTAPPTYRK